jgi:hypothetical protein
VRSKFRTTRNEADAALSFGDFAPFEEGELYFVRVRELSSARAMTDSLAPWHTLEVVHIAANPSEQAAVSAMGRAKLARFA